MSSYSIRKKIFESPNIWPGFVDILATLLIVIIFILMVFTVSQFYLSDAVIGRDKALAELNLQIRELSKILSTTEEELKTETQKSITLSEQLKESETILSQRDQAVLNLSRQIKKLREELLIVAQALEKYEGVTIEEIETAKESLAERVDSYLEYVADEWFEENQLAVENGLKTEMTESFLEGMKGLFEEHYVQIPEDKYDVLESMVEKLDDMETKLNEQIEKNINLNNRLGESVADGILGDVSEGLASTQKEKLASLAESVEFESETEYREKLETLKESYFTSKPNSPSSKTESLSEGVDNAEGVGEISNSMNAYIRSLGNTLK